MFSPKSPLGVSRLRSFLFSSVNLPAFSALIASVISFLEILDKNPQVVNHAIQAMKNLAIEPILSPIRGGTDGSRLSFMGLPTPNIFAGEHSFHSKLEWVSIQDMEMAVRVIIEIAKIWEANS